MRDWSVVFRCTPAHQLPTHENMCTQCSSYKPEGIHECSTFILYLLIINLTKFLKLWAKHNFYYIRYISVCIFSLDIFISFSETSMVITCIGLFSTLWGHRSERSWVFPTHLDQGLDDGTRDIILVFYSNSFHSFFIFHIKILVGLHWILILFIWYMRLNLGWKHFDLYLMHDCISCEDIEDKHWQHGVLKTLWVQW